MGERDNELKAERLDIDPDAKSKFDITSDDRSTQPGHTGDGNDIEISAGDDILKEHRLELAASQSSVNKRVVDYWWAFAVRGIAAIAIGVAVIFYHGANVAITGGLTGIFLLIDGFTAIFLSARLRAAASYRIKGLISIVAGSVVLLWPDMSPTIMLAVMSGWAVFQGITMVRAGENMRDDGETDDSLRIGGLVLVLFGVAAGASLVLQAAPYALVIGLIAVIAGSLMVFIALRFKGLRQSFVPPDPH